MHHASMHPNLHGANLERMDRGNRSRSPKVTRALVGGLGAALLAGLFACVGEAPVLVAPTPSPEGDAAPAGDAAQATDPTFAVDAAPLADAGLDARGPDASNRFCDTQEPAVGVSDFFCADFDGADVAEGFTKANVPDGGSLLHVTDVAFSPPASFATKGEAALVWEKIGAATINEVDVTFRVNVSDLGGQPPPASGFMSIIDIGLNKMNVRLAFVRGAAIDGATHTGYIVQSLTCPSACTSNAKRITTTLTANVWTPVRIVWTRAGQVDIWFDGTKVFGQQLFGSTSTRVTVTTGLRGFDNAPVTARHAIDDLILSVKR